MLNVELLLEKLNNTQIENDDLVRDNKFLSSELEDCEKALDYLQDKFNEYKKLNYGTRCHFCRTTMTWNSDYDFTDYGIEDEEGIVAFLTCPNCNTYSEFYHTIGGEEEC